MNLITRLVLNFIRVSYIFFWWRLRGWKTTGHLPDLAKFVVVGAPHTSMWDYAHMLAAALHERRRPFVTAKQELFNPPFGWFVKAFGGISIDRSATHGVVNQLVNAIREAERMMIIFTPEGTRSYRETWKSGFYYTALRAKVPLVCAAIDYKNKTVRFSRPLEPTGDIEKDFEQIKAFYEQYGRNGLHPEKVNAIAIRPRRLPDGGTAETAS